MLLNIFKLNITIMLTFSLFILYYLKDVFFALPECELLALLDEVHKANESGEYDSKKISFE